MGPGLDICPSELPCLNALRPKEALVDFLEGVPLVVGPLPVEGVHVAAMIEARNGFLNPRASGVAASLSSSSSIGLCGAVTGVGLVWPLSEWDWQDVASSLSREGYRVAPKSGKRVSAVVAGGANPSPSPWGVQCLPEEVSGGGVDLFALDVDVVGGEDGVGGLSCILCEGSFSVPGVPGPDGIVRVVIGLSRRSIAPWVCRCLGSP